MAYSPAHLKLRLALAESIPEGGSDIDTLFRDEQVEALLTSSSDDVDKAALEGWRIKAAHYARLVDVTEGDSRRSMSQLSKQALDMVKAYQDAIDDSAGVGRRTRIGRIKRPKGEYHA